MTIVCCRHLCLYVAINSNMTPSSRSEDHQAQMHQVIASYELHEPRDRPASPRLVHPHPVAMLIRCQQLQSHAPWAFAPVALPQDPQIFPRSFATAVSALLAAALALLDAFVSSRCSPARRSISSVHFSMTSSYDAAWTEVKQEPGILARIALMVKALW